MFLAFYAAINPDTSSSEFARHVPNISTRPDKNPTDARIVNLCLFMSFSLTPEAF